MTIHNFQLCANLLSNPVLIPLGPNLTLLWTRVRILCLSYDENCSVNDMSSGLDRTGVKQVESRVKNPISIGSPMGELSSCGFGPIRPHKICTGDIT